MVLFSKMPLKGVSDIAMDLDFVLKIADIGPIGVGWPVTIERRAG